MKELRRSTETLPKSGNWLSLSIPPACRQTRLFPRRPVPTPVQPLRLRVSASKTGRAMAPSSSRYGVLQSNSAGLVKPDSCSNLSKHGEEEARIKCLIKEILFEIGAEDKRKVLPEAVSSSSGSEEEGLGPEDLIQKYISKDLLPALVRHEKDGCIHFAHTVGCDKGFPVSLGNLQDVDDLVVNLLFTGASCDAAVFLLLGFAFGFEGFGFGSF
ncbi:hypothetical protein NDU88_001557 [Pleurodeles waltl]|uniref:Uncharacterized protein n=1 Tax=Pleurodeles waltl TaxID=8319 RepID=A0AAV7VWT3_PLEWA|nr:hypothetical protein NDU88_001557 [Pleurodeles waltl]